MPKQKTNPKRVPMTVEERENRARDMGVSIALAIFMSTLLDKGYADVETAERLWHDIMERADSWHGGRLTLNDLKKSLLEEYGIRM